MKPILLAVCILFAAGFSVKAQQAYDSRLDYQKSSIVVASIELAYSPDIVEDAIKDYMNKHGYKNANTKGFSVYRGAKLDSADSNTRDLYFKVDKKKKEKDISVISLFSTQLNADILAKDSVDNGQTDKAKSFLNNLTPFIGAHNLEVQITSQQDVLKKAQKKQNNLKNEQGDLEKKLRKIQDELAQNKIDQAAQTQAMQNTVNQDADATKKANKKMSKLLDDQSSLEKKQRNTQQDLDDNKKDQDAQMKEVEKQQQVLDALIAKRK
ncbi:MAG TPA: hypothetical protein VKR53_03970 [Puia sp.]|nr:hypothetical protein [Puia sp.]